MKRVFPSVPAAILCGLLLSPLMIAGWSFIEQRTHSQWLLVMWAVVAFFVPLYFSTVDREYMARRRREKGFLASFIRPATVEAFRESYIPTWLHMAVWFASSVFSVGTLKLLGVPL